MQSNFEKEIYQQPEVIEKLITRHADVIGELAETLRE